MIKSFQPGNSNSFVCDIHALPELFLGRRYSFGLNITMVNSGSITENISTNFRYFEFYSLSQMYDGSGYYWTPNGERIELAPGNAVLIAPKFVHYYGKQDGSVYCEDNVCFTGICADFMFEHDILHNGVWNLGPVRHLQPIIKLAQSSALEDNLEANIRLQMLLLQMYRNGPASHILAEDENEQTRLSALLTEIDATPQQWWSSLEMSNYTRLPVNRLRELFRERTGQLPKQYIDNHKIRQAKLLLDNPEFNLTQIARQLGYHDTCHFSRRFKALTGMAPDFFRKCTDHKS